MDYEQIKINVTAFRDLTKNRTLYWGGLYESESTGPMLDELSKRHLRSGYFTSLENVAMAVRNGVTQWTKEFTDNERADTLITFTSLMNSDFTE